MADDQNDDFAGKSLVMYDSIRASAQDKTRMHDVQQLRERVRRFREKAHTHFESRMPPFKRAQDMNTHLNTPKRLSRKERRLQARARAKSKVKSYRGWVQRFVANKWLGLVLLVFLVLSYLAYMMPGAPHIPTGFGNGPRQHAHVGDAGPPFLGTATLKVPPAWSVERNHHYSLRSWISDLIMWSTATDVEPQRMGPISLASSNR